MFADETARPLGADSEGRFRALRTSSGRRFEKSRTAAQQPPRAAEYTSDARA